MASTWSTFNAAVPTTLNIHEKPPSHWERIVVVGVGDPEQVTREKWPDAAAVGALTSIADVRSLICNLLASPAIRVLVVEGKNSTSHLGETPSQVPVLESLVRLWNPAWIKIRTVEPTVDLLTEVHVASEFGKPAHAEEWRLNTFDMSEFSQVMFPGFGVDVFKAGPPPTAPSPAYIPPSSMFYPLYGIPATPSGPGPSRTDWRTTSDFVSLVTLDKTRRHYKREPSMDFLAESYVPTVLSGLSDNLISAAKRLCNNEEGVALMLLDSDFKMENAESLYDSVVSDQDRAEGGVDAFFSLYAAMKDVQEEAP